MIKYNLSKITSILHIKLRDNTRNIQHSIPVLNGNVQRHFISIMSIIHKTEIKKAEWLWSV